MARIAEALDLIREESADAGRAGRTFEELVAEAFRSHPREWGKDRFAAVWSWAEWPGREEAGFDGRDIGIDLVAEQTPAWGGGLCAIQCKLYRGEVPTKGVDSFLAAASQNIFRDVLLVASAPVSATGHKKLENREGHVLYTAEMDSWVPDWREAVAWSRSEATRRITERATKDTAASPPHMPTPTMETNTNASPAVSTGAAAVSAIPKRKPMSHIPPNTRFTTAAAIRQPEIPPVPVIRNPFRPSDDFPPTPTGCRTVGRATI